MKNKTRKIVRTAVLLAVLLALQAGTKAAGQLVTGSCVNAVLALAAWMAGLWGALAVAFLSPFAAFLLGVGPQLIAIVPAIAVGNMAYVWALSRAKTARGRLIAWPAASALKFAVLYLLVVKLLCSVLPLAEKQVAVFSAMFSWPQLATALIGAAVAMVLAPVLKKALHEEAV